jgi:hypothetical protein
MFCTLKNPPNSQLMNILPTFRYEDPHSNKNSENEVHGTDPSFNRTTAVSPTTSMVSSTAPLINHYTSHAHLFAELQHTYMNWRTLLKCQSLIAFWHYFLNFARLRSIPIQKSTQRIYPKRQRVYIPEQWLVKECCQHIVGWQLCQRTTVRLACVPTPKMAQRSNYNILRYLIFLIIYFAKCLLVLCLKDPYYSLAFHWTL